MLKLAIFLHERLQTLPINCGEKSHSQLCSLIIIMSSRRRAVCTHTTQIALIGRMSLIIRNNMQIQCRPMDNNSSANCHRRRSGRHINTHEFSSTLIPTFDKAQVQAKHPNRPSCSPSTNSYCSSWSSSLWRSNTLRLAVVVSLHSHSEILLIDEHQLLNDVSITM